MSTNNGADFLSFLWNETTPVEAVKLPEGNTGIQGMAGPWSCSICFRFWHDQPIVKEDLVAANGSYLGNKSFPSGAFYYFKTYDAANTIAKLIGKVSKATNTGTGATPGNNIKNLAEQFVTG